MHIDALNCDEDLQFDVCNQLKQKRLKANWRQSKLLKIIAMGR